MPMEHEKGIIPVWVGVNSIMFCPDFRFFLIPSFGAIRLVAQEYELVELIIQRTGTPFLMTK